MTATIPCSPYMHGVTAMGLLADRKRRAFRGLLGWWRRRSDPTRWRRIALTRGELLFYGYHVEACYPRRLSFNPELLDGTEAERVTYCLERYAEREEQELDSRPWWSKAQDGLSCAS